jgi:hypothetical protein
MVSNYDNNDYSTRTTTAATPAETSKKKMWAWVAGIAVVLAIIVAMAMPNRTDVGDSVTTGTPPASRTMPSDTTPSATGVPTPGAPSAPGTPSSN